MHTLESRKSVKPREHRAHLPVHVLHAQSALGGESGNLHAQCIVLVPERLYAFLCCVSNVCVSGGVSERSKRKGRIVFLRVVRRCPVPSDVAIEL